MNTIEATKTKKMRQGFRQKAEALAESEDCEIQETPEAIYINAPDSKEFASQGTSTIKIWDNNTRDSSGKKQKPNWEKLYESIKNDLSYGLQETE